jgi:hypothetical protein
MKLNLIVALLCVDCLTPFDDQRSRYTYARNRQAVYLFEIAIFRKI